MLGGGEREKQGASWRHSVYGAIAGITARTCVAPFERLKILLELQGMERARQALDASAGHGGWRRPKYSVLRGLGVILREEGWRGFYRGHLTNLLHVAPAASARFYSFELYRSLLQRESQPLPPLMRILCGALAGITSTTIAYPLDLLRTRLMAQTPDTPLHYRYRGIVDSFTQTVRKEGPFALWKGLSVSLVGIAPYVAINFATYETLRQKVVDRHGHHMHPLMGAACGATSGAFAMTCTYPFDLLRRRMMVQGRGGEERIYSSIWDACRKIYVFEGISGFFKGIIPSYLKVVPSVGISFGTYEFCKRYL